MKQKTKIMIVEDEAIAAMGMQYALTSSVYIVFEPFSNAEEAIKKVQQYKPDVILIDIYLKGNMDGIQAALKIRLSYDVPIIFITGFYDEETLERINTVESSVYLLKPVETEDIISAIDQALAA